MGLARSTFYDVASVTLAADELVARIGAICDEFECYGYRRVGAALRHQGVVVNGKKLRRLMRERGLQPKRRRRYVNEPPRQSVRQRQGRKLHENLEGRGDLSGRLRDGSKTLPPTFHVHRRRLQQQKTSLGARLSQPCAVRGSTGPEDGQNGSLILSTRRGALHQGVKIARRNTSTGWITRPKAAAASSIRSRAACAGTLSAGALICRGTSAGGP